MISLVVRPIADDQHLLRWVRNRSVIRDPNSGAVLGVFADAFRLRGKENYLSAVWLEFHSGTEAQQNATAVNEFSAVVSVKPKDCFVRGQVGRIKAACADHGIAIRVVHEPEPGLAAHAAVRRYSDTKSELLEALATEAWAEIV